MILPKKFISEFENFLLYCGGAKVTANPKLEYARYFIGMSLIQIRDLYPLPSSDLVEVFTSDDKLLNKLDMDWGTHLAYLEISKEEKEDLK